MGATVLSRILPLRVRTLARVITRLITRMRALAAHPWLRRILLVPWHCSGVHDQTCAMILLAAVHSWITRLTLSLLRSVATLDRQTTCMGGAEWIFPRPSARRRRRVLRAHRHVFYRWYGVNTSMAGSRRRSTHMR